VNDTVRLSRIETGNSKGQRRGGEGRHPVDCIYCRGVFDLLRARWCGHSANHPSKICPDCGQCLCAHPMYGWPHLWREATPSLRRHGFDKLFVLYTKLFEAKAPGARRHAD